MFKVGDKVRVVPTRRKDWNSRGRMEPSVGMIGIVYALNWDGGFDVRFGSCQCDVEGNRDFWTYDKADLQKVSKFKGNK